MFYQVHDSRRGAFIVILHRMRRKRNQRTKMIAQNETQGNKHNPDIR